MEIEVIGYRVEIWEHCSHLYTSCIFYSLNDAQRHYEEKGYFHCNKSVPHHVKFIIPVLGVPHAPNTIKSFIPDDAINCIRYSESNIEREIQLSHLLE
ncbi:MAG: hypothetical protein QNK23_00945 [Crocinitomicaceae bacterium]|nr:hypothetical protein [Crocinitomicaceae bacterium]